jgi:hypothetical protein
MLGDARTATRGQTIEPEPATWTLGVCACLAAEAAEAATSAATIAATVTVARLARMRVEP